MTVKYLREQVDEAVQMPSKENIVKRLNFCIWTEQVTRWVQMSKWDACGRKPISEAQLIGRRCYGGLDLASRTDLAALALVFPDEDGGFTVLPFFWAPKEKAEYREKVDHVPYLMWEKQGLLTLTEGNVTDYDIIHDQICELGDRYQIEELGCDPWNATQLITQLSDSGMTTLEVPQRYAHLSAPTKELEALVVSKKLAHGGNPILRWMASNVAIKGDAAGNIMPAKDRSIDKIDGIVATIIGLSRALKSQTTSSVYETRGLTTLGGAADGGTTT